MLKKLKSPYLPGIALFIISVIIALLVYQDYGVSWDEGSQRLMGWVSYSYIQGTDKVLETYIERDHGVGFELPLVMLEDWFSLTDTRDIYLMRHLITNIFFLLSAFFGYVLIYRLFRNRFFSSLGFVMIAFNPRLYAHSFFNTKDIPFLSSFLISLTIAQVAFEKKKTWLFLLLGIMCGYTTSIRILGIILPIFILIFLLLDIFFGLLKKLPIVNLIFNSVAFLIGFCFMLYICWPTLWGAPVQNFIESFRTLSHFRWSGPALLLGHEYKSDNLPWIYLPVWIGITTPLLFLVSGVGGMAVLFIYGLKDPLSFIKNTRNRNFLLYGMCIFAPVFSVIFMDAVIYDDWRHLYFIYPPFVFFAIFALEKLSRKLPFPIVAALCVLQITSTGIFMVQFHPFQQVYFNRLVSHAKDALKYNFEMEYWACSYKDAIDYILTHDDANIIRVAFSARLPGENNIAFVPKDVRNKFVIVEENENPDYFITNFRSHPGDYHQYSNNVFEKQVLNSTIVRVYKLK